ncbi:Hsp70 family protein [Agrobacterium sp. ST15.16.055]|nr:Hsp70 family protein [Agrobacterium sp. ST15.16.055]MDA5629474.1 Hsp70 family protein [Agrobacterium sp. ST15.16.055]
MLLLTPLSPPRKTEKCVFALLFEKKKTIPTKKSQTFSTAEDNQSAVTIRVSQGDEFDWSGVQI